MARNNLWLVLNCHQNPKYYQSHWLVKANSPTEALKKVVNKSLKQRFYQRELLINGQLYDTRKRDILVLSAHQIKEEDVIQ